MATTTEVAAVVRAGEGPGIQWGPAGVIRILAGADSTGGALSVCEVTEEPGSAAPLHVHHGEAEGFYVVEGEVELTCGEVTARVGAGDWAFGPKDVPHKYVVVGDRPAKMLLVFSRPGFESFFAEAGVPVDAPAGPPDPERLLGVLDKYDLELLETPGH